MFGLPAASGRSSLRLSAWSCRLASAVFRSCVNAMKNASMARWRVCSRRMLTTSAAPPATSSPMNEAPSQTSMSCTRSSRGASGALSRRICRACSSPKTIHQTASDTVNSSQTMAAEELKPVARAGASRPRRPPAAAGQCLARRASVAASCASERKQTSKPDGRQVDAARQRRVEQPRGTSGTAVSGIASTRRTARVGRGAQPEDRGVLHDVDRHARCGAKRRAERSAELVGPLCSDRAHPFGSSIFDSVARPGAHAHGIRAERARLVDGADRRDQLHEGRASGVRADRKAAADHLAVGRPDRARGRARSAMPPRPTRKPLMTSSRMSRAPCVAAAFGDARAATRARCGSKP